MALDPSHSSGEGDIHSSFGASPDAVAAARTFATRAIDSTGFSAEDVALVVTELATNALRHAGSNFDVRLTCHQVLRVEVSDASPHLPLKREIQLDVPGGRGLQIVEAVSSAWGAEPVPGMGKRVWAEFGSGCLESPWGTS